MNEERFPCPCCGYRTYFLPAVGAMELCPVCGWEDAPGEYSFNWSNQVNLPEAQSNFLKFGACEAAMLDIVRSPLDEEARLESWRSFAQTCELIIAFIESAFEDVRLEDGLTIHQREAIDEYGDLKKQSVARKLDPEIHWKDIADEKMRRMGMSLTFFDPEGIRNHGPAFMRSCLRGWLRSFRESPDDLYYTIDDMLLYGLDDGPDSDGYHADSFKGFDIPQRRAVAAFLKFVERVDASYSNVATRALENGWAAYVPDFMSHF